MGMSVEAGPAVIPKKWDYGPARIKTRLRSKDVKTPSAHLPDKFQV